VDLFRRQSGQSFPARALVAMQKADSRQRTISTLLLSICQTHRYNRLQATCRQVVVGRVALVVVVGGSVVAGDDDTEKDHN
jgi:hypothetical protein